MTVSLFTRFFLFGSAKLGLRSRGRAGKKKKAGNASLFCPCYKKSAHDYQKKKKKKKCEYITSRRRSASRALRMDVSLANAAGEKPFLYFLG